MQNKQVALITGANQGIGLQIAKDLSAAGLVVLVGSRHVQRGEIAAREVGGDAVALQIDVTDSASISAAAERVWSEFGRLDVLIQNAAIAAKGNVISPEDYAERNRPSVASIDEMRAVWDTNVFGVLAVYQAMAPLLRETSGSRIVNVSSGAGSLALNSDPNSPLRPGFNTIYPASKTALNALTVAMAVELERDGIRVSAVSPGFTKTKLNGFAGTETVKEGAAEVVRVALAGPEEPTGRLTHATKGIIPW